MQTSKKIKKEKFLGESEVVNSSIVSTLKKKPEEIILLRWMGLIVSLLGFVLYANTLGHGYVLDDYSIILENRITKLGWEAIPTIFKTTYRFGHILVSNDLYRPVTKSFFAIQWALSPNNPLIGHCTNLIAFTLTVLILFNTLNLYSKGNKLFAFIATLLFAAHPIHTEVVANIKSLDEILGLLFSICAMRFIHEYTRSFEVKKLLVAAFFFLCALMSKESSITFIAIFPLTVFFFTGTPKRKQLHIFLLLFFVAAIFFFIRQKVTGMIAAESHSGIDNVLVMAPDFAHHFATAVYIMGLYVKLFFFPHPLVFDYSTNQIPIIGLDDYRFIISFLIFILLASIAMKLFKKKSWITLGILFFFITSSLSSNIVLLIGTSMGERLMYTPSLGWCIAIGYLISRISVLQLHVLSINNFFEQNIKAIAITILIVIAFGVKTISRNIIWKDNYTLFTNDIKLADKSARAHYYMGSYINKEEFLNGRTRDEQDSIISEGICELKKSIEIYPPFVDAWNLLGIIYDRLNKPDSAIYFYRTALIYNPTDPTIHNNIGTVFFKLGYYIEARQAFQKAIQINPNCAELFTNLGSTYGAVKENDSALYYFNHALAIDSNYAQAYYLTAVIYHNVGEEQKAQFYLNKAELFRNNQPHY